MSAAPENLLAARIAEVARRHGSRPAFSDPRGRSLSHAGLFSRAKYRALRLRSAMAGMDGPVALLLPKSAALVEHLLGVVLAGRAYVCLDAKADDAELARQLNRLGARLLVIARARAVFVPGVKTVRAFRGPGWLTAFRSLSRTSASACCALVRTSGSTGEPCGVWQESAAILHHAEWTIRSQQIDEHSRLSWLAAPGVAAAHSHLFAALLSGACLCPFDPARDGLDEMSRWLRAERITHLHLTPSLLRAWLESLPDAPPDGPAFPELLGVKLGGEPARAADARLLRRKLGPAPRLLNGLGMSEASGNLALCEITVGDESGDGLLPVGWPVDGRDVVLEKEPGVLAGDDETGEIVVRDRWVSPGYEPVGARDTIRATDDPGVRELRTGDAGRRDGLGRLVHLGRLDRRIRVRGMSVDLAEVEARLAGLADVAQVAALAEPDCTGYRVAVVLKADTPETRKRTTQFFGESGAPKIKPARVAYFADIPRKPTGKRDDAALLANWPEDARTDGWRGCEIYVRDAWIRVLGHADFGPDDAFARSGGDSLSAMNLAVELSRLARREVGMADIAGLATVAEQAQALENGKLGRVVGLATSARFHIEWVSVPAAKPTRDALVHPGGYTRETDVWLASALMAGLEGTTALRIARANIEDPRVEAPANWDDMVEPLLPGALAAKRPLLVGVCLGSLVIADLADRLAKAGRDDVELILFDPWTPGLGRSAIGIATHAEHPRRIHDYYELFKSRDYAPLPALKHVILAGDDSHFEARRSHWIRRVPSPAHLHVVRGDHMSFLREHRDATARKFAEVARATPAPDQGATS